MRRLLLTLPLMLMPLLAAGQTLGSDQINNTLWLQQQQTLLKSGQPAQGSLLLQSHSSTTAQTQNTT